MVLIMLVSLFSVRIVLRSLGVEDYGVYTAIGGVIASMSFISGVLAAASQRFFSLEIGKKGDGSLSNVFSTVFLAYCIVTILIVIATETAGFWFVFHKMTIPEASCAAARKVFHLALASFAVTLLSNPFQALIISFEKMNVYAYLSILEAILKLGTAFLLRISPTNRLELYAILMFVSTVVVQGCYVYSGCRAVPGQRMRITWAVSGIRDVFSYVSWTMFGSLAWICNTQGLNILLNMFYGPLANAAYAISYQVSAAVNNLASNFYVAVKPPMMKAYAAKDEAGIKSLFYFSTKTIYVLIFIIAVPFIYKTDFILRLWLSEVADYMVAFVRCIIVFSLVARLGDPITVLFQAAGKVRVYHGVVDTFTILTLPLAYLALKKGAPAVSVFVISISVFLLALFMRLLMMKRHFGLSLAEYAERIILPITASVGLAIAIILLLDRLPDTMVCSILGLGMSFAATALVAWFVVLNGNERDRVLSLLKKRIH